jgi:natural product precursor
MNTLKLNKLSAQNLADKQMNKIRGGYTLACGCGCKYAGTPGGSSIAANRAANCNGGLVSANVANLYYCATVTP